MKTHTKTQLARWSFLALVAAAVSFPSASAQDSYWDGSSGDFTNQTKWNAGVPFAPMNAWFTNGAASHTVSWSTNATTANAYVATKGTAVLSEQMSSSIWWITNQYVIGSGGLTGKVTHGSGALVVTNAAGAALFIVGDTGSQGTLTLTGGLIVADRLLAASNVTSTLTLNGGELVTRGGGSLVNVGSGNRFMVGNTSGQTFTWRMEGGGTNLLLGGSTYLLQLGQNAGAYARLIVSGAGTVFTNVGNTAVGYGGRGFLMISNGAQAFAGGALRLAGNGASSTNNEVIVTGANSKWIGGVLTLGMTAGSSNVVSVLDGGEIQSSSGAVGAHSGSTNNTMIVSGANSAWTISGDLSLGGNQDSASDGGVNSLLLIANGGQVTVGTKTKIGNWRGSSNSVLRVTGADSLFRAGASPLSVGSNANASGSGALVLVDDGGTLEANNMVSGWLGTGVISNTGGVYQFSSGTPSITTNTPGSVILSGGTVSFKGVGNAALGGDLTKILYLGQNTLRLDGATNTSISTYAIGTNAGTPFATLDLAGNGSVFQGIALAVDRGGTLTGSGRIGSVNVTNHGAISPGHSPGALVFASNLTLMDGASLNLELGGTNSSLYDHLQVLGTLTLTGALNVTLINGFTPSNGDRFDLLDWTTLLGSFETVNLPGGYNWDISSLYNDGALLVIPIPEPSLLIALTGGAALLVALRRRPRE